MQHNVWRRFPLFIRWDLQEVKLLTHQCEEGRDSWWHRGDGNTCLTVTVLAKKVHHTLVLLQVMARVKGYNMYVAVPVVVHLLGVHQLALSLTFTILNNMTSFPLCCLCVDGDKGRKWTTNTLTPQGSHT